MKRAFSSLLALSVLGTQCLFAYQPENTFWAERRKATRRTSSTLLASLPLEVGSVRANSLTAKFPSLQKAGSSLSPSVARSVPDRFSKDHAKILAALSPAFGSIRKVSLPKNPSIHGPVVIHIQDVHMNQEAQWNIRETVKSLLASGQVNLVALEGATEPIDLQAFADYPHAKAVEMAADYLLKENKISGPIHAALTARGQLPRILGVDDPAHYEANVQAYRDSAPKLGKTHQELLAIQKEIEAQKRVVFSPALQFFDRQVQQYREGKSSLGDYVHRLTNQVDPDLQWNVARHFLTALNIERRLDFKLVESERARLIERLTQTLTQEETNTLVAQSLDYRKGHLRYADFYTALRTLCEKKGIQLKSYPALDSYVRYVLMADGIDPEQLMAEMAALEKSAYARQIKTPEEKSLEARSRQAWLTEKLVDFALTPTEWEEYDAGPRPLSPQDLASFELFYKEAHARDTAMAINLLHAMKDDSSPSKSEEWPVTILVTGGFHAEGMTQQLTQQGATVISYVPKIEKVDTIQGSTYLSVFTQEKSSLEKLFVGNKLFLAHNPISRADQRIQAPLLVASATFFLGLLTASFDFSSAYHLGEGLGAFSSLELSTMMIEGVIGTSAAKVAFTVATSPSGEMSVKTGPVGRKGTRFWNILKDATTEEIFGNLRKVSLRGFLKGRLPAVVLGTGLGLSGPFSMIFGGLFLLWVIKGIPQQYQFVLDHVNHTSHQTYVRSVGAFLLNVIAFSLPLFGDFTLLSNALLAGTTGAIAAHTLWNILAQAGQKVGLWEQDYRLGLIMAEDIYLQGVHVTRESGVFGTLSNEVLVEILGSYLERIKKIAPHIWFVRTGGAGADLSRDRQHLIFHVPREITPDQVRNYMDDALGELESYLIQPHAGLIYVLPFSRETGEWGYIQQRLTETLAEISHQGQALTVMVERPSYIEEKAIQTYFQMNPGHFQEILFENDRLWKDTFYRMQPFLESSAQTVEDAIRKGVSVTEPFGEETLLGWLINNRVRTIFEEVEPDSQRLILQSLWFLSVPFDWAPWPVKHASGTLDSRDMLDLEKKQSSEVLAFSKSLYIRESRLAEQLASLPISPHRAYVFVYGPEHLPHLPAIPGLTILPAQVGNHYEDLEIRRAMNHTLYDQLVQKYRETLEDIYGSPQSGRTLVSLSNGQRKLLSDTLEKESESWSLLNQKTLLFSLIVQWGKRRLSEDDALRLSRLVERMTDSMTTQAIRLWTMGLLNQERNQWDLLFTKAEHVSSQDLNFIKTTINNPGGPASLAFWIARRWGVDVNKAWKYGFLGLALEIPLIFGLKKIAEVPVSIGNGFFAFLGLDPLIAGLVVVLYFLLACLHYTSAIKVEMQKGEPFPSLRNLWVPLGVFLAYLIPGGVVFSVIVHLLVDLRKALRSTPEDERLITAQEDLSGERRIRLVNPETPMGENSRAIDAHRIIVIGPAGKILTLENLSGGKELPGGKPNEGEDPLKALIRELEEETGIVVSEDQIKFLGDPAHTGPHFSYEYTNGHQPSVARRVRVAVVHLSERPSIKKSHEHKSWEWVTMKTSLAQSPRYTLGTRLSLIMYHLATNEGMNDIISMSPLDELLYSRSKGSPLLVKTSQGNYILHPAAKKIDRARFGAAWQKHLFEKGFPVPEIKPNSLSEKNEDSLLLVLGGIPMILETYLSQGVHVDRSQANDGHFRALGKFVGAIQKASADFVPPPTKRVGGQSVPPSVDPILVPSHGDLHFGNFTFLAGADEEPTLAAVFDFEYAAMGFRTEDLVAIGFGEKEPGHIQSLIDGFNETAGTPLQPHELKIMARELHFQLTDDGKIKSHSTPPGSNMPGDKASPDGSGSPSTLSQVWRLFSDNGPLDHILRLAKWESAPLSLGIGLAVGAHILLGASLGWAFGVAILAGALGGAHWFGTYAVVGGKLQEVRGQNSLGKALSWFLWTSVFGVSLYLLGSVLPQDLVAFGMFLGTWIGTYFGVKDHGLSNREWVVNNIPDLTDAQRVIAREILKNLDGRPITLDMNQMRELVLHTAENIGKRKDSGAIDLSAPIALSSSGIKLMFVSSTSLTAKALENLRTMLDRDENIFVLAEGTVPGISEDRTVVVPFGALPQSQRGNLPFREVLLAEVRSRIDALAQDHPVRRRSSDAVLLFLTADLQLNGVGLKPADPLTEAAKNPMLLLLESSRAFPLLNQAWQDSLKALRALAEFA